MTWHEQLDMEGPGYWVHEPWHRPLTQGHNYEWLWLLVALRGLRTSSALVGIGFAGTSSPIPLCTRQVYSASLPGHVFEKVVCRSAADLCISFFTLDGPARLCSSSEVMALQERQLGIPMLLHDLDKRGDCSLKLLMNT